MCFIVKYVLFVANVIFALAGLALIGVGSAVVASGSAVLDVIPAAVNAIPISVIVIGIAIFIVGLFGCCGAIRENRCLLGTYAVIVFFLAAGQMYLAVVIFMAMDDIYPKVAEWLADSFRNEDMRQLFHAVEAAFECCGTIGWESYLGILPALPPSCCAQNVTICDNAQAFPGCNGVVGDFFSTYGEVTASVIVVIVAVQLLAMIFGFSLCNNISNKRREAV